jgi:methylated-DNA-[protein]-cysteine S-methyltransferase
LSLLHKFSFTSPSESHTMTTLPPAYTAQTIFLSPLGPLLLARTAQGLAGAWFEAQKHHPRPLAAPHQPGDELLQLAVHQLQAYFSGERTGFELPLDLIGSEFQRAVWQSLLTIEAGKTNSYGAIAKGLNAPTAARAVGAAVARNPVSVIVPCHRVVGSSGALTGYAGGIERKHALLALEGRPELALELV